MQNNFVCQKAVAFMRQLFLPPHACFPSGRAHPLPLQAAAFGFSGRFGISVLSGFPDDHPLWQENFSKLALQSHVRPETLPAKALSKDCYRYPKRCSRDELRSCAPFKRSAFAKGRRNQTSLLPFCRYLYVISL